MINRRFIGNFIMINHIFYCEFYVDTIAALKTEWRLLGQCAIRADSSFSAPGGGQIPMGSVGIVDFGSYLPGESIDLDRLELDEDPLINSPLLRPPHSRHYKNPDQPASEMIELAAVPMFERIGIDPSKNIDIIITNVLLPDKMITGCGAEVAYRLNCRPEWIIDLHNGGCASLPFMLKLAQRLMDAEKVRSALLCNVQNTAGTIFRQPELRRKPQSAVPGDGCGVTYLVAGAPSEILGVETLHGPEYTDDMDVGTSCGRHYWEAGSGALNVKFAESKFHEIIDRGNTLVPQAVRNLCRAIGVNTGDIDVLVTNQPNRMFLRNWREELGIEPARHLDTFDRFGNLYGAGVPVTLAAALREGEIRDGALVAMAGFAHAGDFAAAAAFRWHSPGRPTSPVASAGNGQVNAGSIADSR